MPCATSVEEAVELAAQRWPSWEVHERNHDHACGPCPICGQADDNGFVIYQSGYFFCRPGKHDGWLDDDKPSVLTREQIAIRRQEAEIKRLQRQQEEQETRLQALERMARCTDHERYHELAVNSERAMEWFCSQGIQPWAVFDFKMGVCSRCPTDREGRPSYTFPIWRRDGPLWSIRHRLMGPDRGGKYRPHRRNLGRQLVNARYLSDWSEQAIVIEGTKKVRVCQQYDLPVVGILGKTGLEDRWLSWFHPAAEIVLGLDPDAQGEAEQLGHRIAKQGKRVRVAQFPAKPDDLFVDGCTRDEWMRYIHLARKVA